MCLPYFDSIYFIKNYGVLLKPYGSRDSEVRQRCGKVREEIGRQKGRGFNLCVAPSPRNQVSRISDGAEKGLRIMEE